MKIIVEWSKGYALRTGESQRKDRRYCENESNLKVIQSVMGHSDIQTTMDIYAECTQEKKDEVFANLNGKIMIK